MFEPSSHFPPLGQTKRRAGNRCQVFQGEGRRAGLDRCYNWCGRWSGMFSNHSNHFTRTHTHIYTNTYCMLAYVPDLYAGLRTRLIARLNSAPEISSNINNQNNYLPLTINERSLQLNIMKLLSHNTVSNPNITYVDQYNYHHLTTGRGASSTKWCDTMPIKWFFWKFWRYGVPPTAHTPHQLPHCTKWFWVTNIAPPPPHFWTFGTFPICIIV